MPIVNFFLYCLTLLFVASFSHDTVRGKLDLVKIVLVEVGRVKNQTHKVRLTRVVLVVVVLIDDVVVTPWEIC